MKLTTAEEWLNTIGEAVMTDCFANKNSGPGERTEKAIRQIQADALRWAAEVTGGRAFRVDAYRVIHDQANQLHPKSCMKNLLTPPVAKHRFSDGPCSMSPSGTSDYRTPATGAVA